MEAQCSRKAAPFGGCKIIFDDFTGDKTMEGIEQSSIPQYLKPLPPKNSRSSDVDGMS